jgi:hypothetical protein
MNSFGAGSDRSRVGLRLNAKLAVDLHGRDVQLIGGAPQA